jgi:hypothetical protein
LKKNTETQRHRGAKKATTDVCLLRRSLRLCAFVSLCFSSPPRASKVRSDRVLNFLLCNRRSMGTNMMARARRSLNFGDSYTCTYCLQVIKWDHHRTRPTRDHFFPKSKKKLLMGAKPIFVICCQPCNSRKSDKVFSSIEEVREFIRSRKKARECNIDGN